MCRLLSSSPMAAPVAQPPYSTSRETVSGRSAAHWAATAAPMDQPRTSKRVMPSASVTAVIVSSSSSIVRGPSYASESPQTRPVVADQGAAGRQRLVEHAIGGNGPPKLEMAEPSRRHQEERPGAGHRIGHPPTIG
jgi:hypothetical protein